MFESLKPSWRALEKVKIIQAHHSPEKAISNAIVFLIEVNCFKVEESYESLVDFFDSHQFHLQRVHEYTEFSDKAAKKLLLLRLMAVALSNMVNYIKAMRQKPTKKVLKVLARKKDDIRSAATPTGGELIRDTSDNLEVIREVDHQADDSALAPQVAKAKSKDPAPPEDDHKAGSKNGSKVSLPELPPDKLKHWLNPPNRLIDHVHAHPGTGKWLIQSRTFRWWKKKEKGALLIICGDPGSGKTILCSSIIKEVNRTRNTSKIIACYFFDSKQPDKRNFRGLLASLVTQLCENSKRTPKSMPALYTKCRNGSNPPTEADLTQLLNRFLTELQAQFSIHIVIDGVDNCIEAESTEPPLRSRHPKLNICVTSSLKGDMEKSLKPLVAAVSSRQMILHEEKGQKEDIRNYIAAFVQSHMQTLPDKDKDVVIKTLSERAGWMFGWMLTDSMPCLKISPHRLPTSWRKEIQYASQLFQCLVAAIRPLSLKELADISAALIARDKDDPTIVQFSHKSVKEFLTSSRLRTSGIENAPRYHFSREAANGTLARESSPLALYAAQYWAQHTQQGNAATKIKESWKDYSTEQVAFGSMDLDV
ncbi:hypothetical protein BGY98DRAFT_1104527 [Russula aff. rugulosa BPL654]|nr:hypothetical protein BGY98DRAFT_1104527 [Russula aff. rugulosa BPL654]